MSSPNALSLLSAILAFAALHLSAQMLEKPNILLIVSDDHGQDALGCYGNPVIKTPHMDRLAEQGTRFTQAYCTSASCAASRSVILTGKYGHATGSYGHVHDYHHFSTFEETLSLPVILENGGYHTARIGKYHLAPESVFRFQTVLEADPRSTVEMAEACQNVIHSEKPFFLYFCPDDPHRGHPFTPNPWNAPNSFGNREEGYPGAKPDRYAPDDVVVPPFLPDSPESRAEIAEYYQSVSRIDQGVGRLIELIGDAGKSDNTIVLYISDNGIAFPGAKTTVYEPGIKLPCIVKHPRAQKRGVVNDAMISWVDLTPTILDWAGLNDFQDQFHGRSFADIIEQESSSGWDEIYAAHNFHELTMYYPMRVVRDGQYKLIWNIAHGLPYPFASDLWAASTWQEVHRNSKAKFGMRSVNDYLHRAEFELYDLQADPNELHNLANHPQAQATLERLKQKLKAFQFETSDPWQIMWDNESQLQGTGVNL